jgi:cell division septal protein FtsQ
MLQKKSKKITLYLFIFLIIGTLNNKNLNNIKLPKVNQIIVSGLNVKNNLELMNNLNYLKFDSLFFLNEIKLTEIITTNNLVEEYSVFKKYPSTLDIKIKQTKFLAQFKKNGINFLLGSNGRLTKTPDIKKNIPFIFGDFKTKSFFELKKIIDETDLDFYEIKNLYFFRSGRWDIETVSGLLIKLPKKNIKSSLNLFIDILENNIQEKISKIDLRQYNQIIINE